jgi:hypothetical protein
MAKSQNLAQSKVTKLSLNLNKVRLGINQQSNLKSYSKSTKVTFNTHEKYRSSNGNFQINNYHQRNRAENNKLHWVLMHNKLLNHRKLFLTN